MVRTGAGHLQDLDRAAGEIRRAAQHVEELVLGHQAGAGERGEQAARLHHAQRQLVHVQVLLQRSDHLVAVAGHLRRVQDHHVVLLAAVGGIAQPREDVGLDELRAHVVQARIALGDLDDVFIDVDADHVRGATRRRIHRETAGVAAQVEHALAFHLLAQPLAVLALVGEETGLVGTGRVGAELDAVLGDHRCFGGGIAVEVEAFLLLHVLVGEAVEAAAGELLAQRVVDPLAVAEHAGGEELDHHQVAVAVDHQAGQAVAFAVHHAPGIGHRIELQHLTAQRHRLGDLAREPAGIDRHVRVGFEDAHGNARMPVVEPPANELAIDADHVDDGAGLGPDGRLLDQFLEDPRVAGTPRILEADNRKGGIHPPIVNRAPGSHSRRPPRGHLTADAAGRRIGVRRGVAPRRCRRHFEPAGSGATAVPADWNCERDLRRTGEALSLDPHPILRCRSSPSGLAFIFPTDIPNADDR